MNQVPQGFDGGDVEEAVEAATDNLALLGVLFRQSHGEPDPSIGNQHHVVQNVSTELDFEVLVFDSPLRVLLVVVLSPHGEKLTHELAQLFRDSLLGTGAFEKLREDRVQLGDVVRSLEIYQGFVFTYLGVVAELEFRGGQG